MKVISDVTKLAYNWILLVTVLVTVSGRDAVSDVGSDLCSALSSEGVSLSDHHHHHQHHQHHHLHAQPILPPVNCSDPNRQVTVTVRAHVTNNTATASIWACPSIERVQFRVSEVKGHFQHVPRGVTLASCVGTNDTAVFAKGHHRTHLALRFSPVRPFVESPRLNYSYSQRPGPGGSRHHINSPHVRTIGHVHPVLALRKPRAVSEHSSSITTSDNTSHGNTVLPMLWSSSACGKSQTCIRYGEEGCVHFECYYLLTYRVINFTHVDMEMSARTKGWVAVGFSSDTYMGGGDDVVGCKRKGQLSDEIETMSMRNQGHSRPKMKDNRLEMIGGRLQDGYIYCRLKRPLKYTKTLDDSDLDLTNDWHQLYAFGDIDGIGMILQHSEIPRVSQEKITMLRPRNSRQLWSSASLPVAHVLHVILVLTVSFAVS